MKKVISGKELREKMLEAINLLGGTVKTTLGPKGNNVIIDHSTFSPFITNDGVTIAQNIESDDEIINTILELAKEASIKTNEIVGDGTTTTLVLLESIFTYGLKLIDEGNNPLIIKKELDRSLNTVLNLIKQKSRKPTKKDLELIACNSANDKEIGKIISEVYSKVKNKNAINIREDDIDKTKINYIKGYSFETNLASSYFLNIKEIKWDTPYLLLVNDNLDDLEQITDILNNIIKNDEKLVIIAKDYSEGFINDIVSLYLDGKIQVILLKSPEYGMSEYYFYNDINAILENTQVNDSNYITLQNLKKVKSITINKDFVNLTFTNNNYIKKHIKELKSLLSTDKIHYNYLNEKISMFNYGTAEIIVGAQTKTERREKKMRFDDALCAIESAINGVLPGSGIILFEISENLNENNIGDRILKYALAKPLEQILINSALDIKIMSSIKKMKYKKIFNIKTNEFEDVFITNILDPTLVVINSLKNACSIASMLLTTSSLVINEYQNNYNKINDYNDL